MQRITAYLLYEDVDGALEWLSRAFGFKECGIRMRGEDGRTRHAAMEFSGEVFMMGCPGAEYRNPKRIGQVTEMLYIRVEDVDAHFSRARQAGAKILHEPQDQDYGDRRYGAEDPEGHQWYFAESLEGRRGDRK